MVFKAAMAAAGSRLLGHAAVQLLIILHRYSLSHPSDSAWIRSAPYSSRLQDITQNHSPIRYRRFIAAASV